MVTLKLCRSEEAAAAAATVKVLKGSERLMGEGEEGVLLEDFRGAELWFLLLWLLNLAERIGVHPLGLGEVLVVVVVVVVVIGSSSQAPQFNLGSSERSKKRERDLLVIFNLWGGLNVKFQEEMIG